MWGLLDVEVHTV